MTSNFQTVAKKLLLRVRFINFIIPSVLLEVSLTCHRLKRRIGERDSILGCQLSRRDWIKGCIELLSVPSALFPLLRCILYANKTLLIL